MPASRLDQVLERIDAANREDPHEEVAGGIASPREHLYATRLTDWVLRLRPEASEALRIAARGQHIRRWTIPRERYERTRRGYLRWREVLKAFHAEQVTQLMRDVGYPDDLIERVRLLILKKHLGTDSEAQTLEDALCLVFLETQFEELKRKTPEESMREIVRKTWRKMSARAREEALRLPLSVETKRWLSEALKE